jgi:hypothetical protein
MNEQIFVVCCVNEQLVLELATNGHFYEPSQHARRFRTHEEATAELVRQVLRCEPIGFKFFVQMLTLQEILGRITATNHPPNNVCQ